MAVHNNLKAYIQNIPKAELHLHLEGSMQPELLFRLAKRNKIEIEYTSVEALKQAYQFNNLQEFLDLYYQGAGVLQTEDDFYALTYSYLQLLHQQNVLHAELMFDPQTHMHRGIPFSTVLGGITNACSEAHEKWGLSTKIILSILRHLSEEDAIKTLKEALPYKKHFFAIGLDSSEKGNPPEKFKTVYKLAKEEGLMAVAHAGEEGPAQYVIDALDQLSIQRIDHGNRSLEDADLVARIVQEQIPLTLCPLSNLALKVIGDLKDHPLKTMMEKGMLVTINSDDPAYFGGQLNDNYLRIAEALDLSKEDITQLAINSFKASFISDDQKKVYIDKVLQFNALWK